ncbi:MAG: SNF2-related protein [Promethearchaeota archaeon]
MSSGVSRAVRERLEGKVLDLLKKLRDAPFGGFDWFLLLEQAQRLSLVTGFQHLLATGDWEVRLFPHQEEAVLRVLQRMQGSALLADEVGLGKTIIAGAVLSELQARDLVNSVLVVAPPSLMVQWQAEMEEKFNEVYPVVASGKYGAWKADKLITSIHLVTMYPEKVLSRPWDALVVDEAHRVKNRRTKAWKTLNAVKRKYTLLLTATPMENYLEDIYNLVTLLKPGLLGTRRQFLKQYGVPGNKRACSDPLGLRRKLDQVMVRRRRDEVRGIFFPERVARTVTFKLDRKERALYDDVTNYVATNYSELEEFEGGKAAGERGAALRRKYKIESPRFLKRKLWLHKFTLMLLQRRICSAPAAARVTLSSMLEARREKGFDVDSIPLLERMEAEARALATREGTKVARLKTVLDHLPGKCVVFTEFADTLDFLDDVLGGAGYSYAKFHGGLSSAQRAQVVREFREQRDVLLSTDAGSEGLNLQVANALVNFDLPWNPMRVEQRIGRVYRLAQQAARVFIFNLSSRDTIEEYLLNVLFEKIGVFRTILGDLSHLLGKLVRENDDGRSVKLEAEIMKFFVHHGHSDALRKELEKMVTPVVEKVELEREVSRDVLDVESFVETY